MRRERAAAYALGAAIYVCCGLILTCWAAIAVRVISS